MAPTDRNEVLPSERDVAYFVKLHLDTVRFVKHSDEPKKIGLYEVEGKARPMLVCRVFGKGSGRRFFRVFPMTTVGFDELGQPKACRVSVGRLPNKTKESFVMVDDIQTLPENMLSPDWGRPSEFQTLEPHAFRHALAKWREFALRSGASPAG